MSIDSLLPFIKEIDRLKKIERQAQIHSGGRHENTAEHSWHLAMTVLVFEKLSPTPLDVNKAVKMALLHDIVEIDAGDTFVYSDLSGKLEKEIKALDRICGLLPEPISQDFKDIWHEFEEGLSPEAKFVSAIDRFLPLYSNYLNEGYSWKNHNVTSDKVVHRCEAPITAALPELWAASQRMIDESIKNGHLKA